MKTMRRIPRLPLRIAPLAFCILLAASVSEGTTYRLILDGNGDSVWEGGVAPASNIEDSDLVVASGAGGGFKLNSMRSLTFEPPMTKQFSVWTYSNCRIGAGGVTASDIKGVFLYGYKTITMPCSQRWLLDGETSGEGYRCYAGLSLAEDAVWTACGRKTLNFNNTGSKGTSLGRLRTNMTLNFSTANSLYNLPTNGLYWTNNELDGGPVRTNSLGQPNITFTLQHVAKPDIGLPPIEWDFTNPNGTWKTGITLAITENARGEHLRCGAWSGAINDGVLRIDYNVAKDYCNPFRSSRMVLANAGTLDSSARQCIWWKRGMLEIGDDNAFGVSNRLSLLIGHGGAANDAQIGGVAAGIVAAPGVTVRSDICVTNANVYHTLGRQVWLGAMDAGAPAVFTGDVENNDDMLSQSLMWARCPSQVRLFSGRGAEAQFTGSFSGSALLPMEIHGWGATRLSGDNSGLKAGVSVRSGTLKVGGADALGHRPVTLGGTVPDAIDVEYCSYTGLTFKSGSPLIVDGCVVQPGERVLYLASQFKVYKLGENGSSFAADSSVSASAYGLRVKIAKGVEYAGTAFECVHSYNNGSVFVEEPPEPAAALLADGAVNITNDVTVTDNLSSGASSIGGCTGDTSVFSGKITLNRGVTFHAAAGGVARFTGSITDAGETLNPFAFSGTGTVELPAGTELAGRAISFPGITDAALDATGQTSCTLVTAADGLNLADIDQPSLSSWQLRVKATSIRAVKNAGTKILVQ